MTKFRIPDKSNPAPANHSTGKSSWSIGRIAISLAILFHFGVLGLTYLASPRRSVIQDEALATLHPYLMGGNWYVERFPVAWTTSQASDRRTRIEVSREIQPKRWEAVYDTKTSGDRERVHALLRMIHALSEQEYVDGVVIIFQPILNRVVPLDSGYRSVRIVQADPGLNDEGEKVVFEANVVTLDQQMKLIPRIEPFRSVKSNLNPESK